MIELRQLANTSLPTPWGSFRVLAFQGRRAVSYTHLLWVEMYGARAVFESFPGSKLYLLLQKELEIAGVPAKRSSRSALLPTRIPNAVVHASAHESLTSRVHRYRAQIRFIAFRLSFHIVEGLRFALESYRWRRQMGRLTQ